MSRWCIFSRLVVVIVVLAAVVAIPTTQSRGESVSSLGAMQQINSSGLPGTHVGEFCTLWEIGDPTKGLLFYANPATSPTQVFRATTTDGGKTWSSGVSAGLQNPGSASLDVRNPVVRDFRHNGSFVGFFGTKQGVYGSGYGPNDVLFRGDSADEGQDWSGESLVLFDSGAFAGHTGLNGFVEVFETSTGLLRAYTAMNNAVGARYTRLVESSDGGATWTDMGTIAVPGPGSVNNVVSANGPVFRYSDGSQTKLGWFVFGESNNNRGVNFLVSTDEGLTWTSGGFSIQDNTIRSGDANFIDDDTVRLFYYRNVSGGSPSDRQLWYQDFDLDGFHDIQPSNLYYSGGGAVIPEPSAMVAIVGMAVIGLAGWLWRRRTKPAQG